MRRLFRWPGLIAIVLGALLASCKTNSPKPVEPATTTVTTTPPADPMVSVNTLIDAPADFASSRIGTADYPIPPEAKYLRGVRVCLDPGHGGRAAKRGYKRGPTGVREAEMNLRVAEYLRAFLEGSGAEVLLTRESDVDVSLRRRAEMANEWKADVFLSLHHNAFKKPTVNRTTVWFHLGIDERPSSLDLARHVYHGLRDALRLEQITGLPLKSDGLMHKRGFGVLRAADVPAALCESSFFTHPEEEQRLRDPAYNLREAHGLFVALARYAAGGLPRATLVEPKDGTVRAGETLRFKLDDGLRGRRAWGSDRQMIFRDSIGVRLDGETIPHRFVDRGAKGGYRLDVDLPADLRDGRHRVHLHFENMFKNSNLTPSFDLVCGELPDAIPAARARMTVDVATQKLHLFDGESRVRTYDVSTATKGTGNVSGSNQTPLGRHRVCEKVGGDQPRGMAFVERIPTGKKPTIHTDATDAKKEWILSRILWLDGLEDGVNKGGNVDSRKRYIYIHGTNEEGLIGQPASHGCIRMRNDDVIDLYERVPVGAVVEIVARIEG